MTEVRDKRKVEAPPKDFVALAIAYAEGAIEDRARARHCKWVRLAAKRFIDDLKRAQLRKNPPFYWDPAKANEACEFIEQLPHVEGTWESDTIVLEPAQCLLVCQLFGFRKENGRRRFDTVLWATARKNAKTTIAAAIMLAIFCLEPELGPQLLSAATTGQQARIAWGVAKRMVERSEDLGEAFTLKAFANAIVRYEVGGSFKPINSKASTQDGLNPSAVLFDEVHAQKDANLYNVLRSAEGAREDPLYLYTTTEGYETPGPWPEIRQFALNILEGVIEADNFLVLYYALDEEDKDFDESKWIKANPLLGISISIEKIRKHALEAKHQPSVFSEFQIKRLNRSASVSRGWIDLPAWRKCPGDKIDLERMTKLVCFGAFDLASTSDMCSWRLVWLEEDRIYTWGRYYVPEGAVAQRMERGTVRYDGWIRAGWVTQTEGDVTDYNVIEKDIKADYERFRPQSIGFDPWNAQQMVNNLLDAKLPLVQFRQGPASYHPAMQTLERTYMAGKLHDGDDPVLLWHASNIVARKDVNGNMAPHKEKSAGKIDGMCSLLMGVGVAQTTIDRREFKLFFV